MIMRFVPGLENGVADIMSGWGVKSGAPKIEEGHNDEFDVCAVSLAA